MENIGCAPNPVGLTSNIGKDLKHRPGTESIAVSIMDPELAVKAVKTARETGGAYADVLCQRRSVQTVRYEDGKLDDLSLGIDAGAGVRVIKGDLAAFAHTDIIDREHLLQAARIAAEALKYASPGKTLQAIVSTRVAPPAVCKPDSGSHNVRRVVGYLSQCDEAARGEASEVRQVTAVHNAVAEESLLANSLGEVRTSACQRTRLVIQVVASCNGVIQVGQEAPGALAGPDFYTGRHPSSFAVTAARRALTMLTAKPSPTGRMAVVMNSGTGGVLLHEACGHGLEVDHVHKGASVYGGKVGKSVASRLVSASDNPTLPGLWGSYEYDDEGTPSQRTVLIENGVLKEFIYARHESMKDGRQSTGNGRRQSFRYTPVPRMSNTYIEPGDSDPADIIASTPRGLYAKKMGGGQVDPVTGDYVFAVSEGYLIEGGKIGHPVRGATLIGNGPRTLELIDAVGNDLSFEEGTCGKDGQGVPVTTGGPTFRIAELTVGGTEL
jgi:TldD protein